MVISENGIGVYNSFTASLMFLEKVVQKAITMCTMGERVGVWFTSLLRHWGNTYTKEGTHRNTDNKQWEANTLVPCFMK
jgi:hypothetical protein